MLRLPTGLTSWLFALVLALIIWVVAVQQENPLIRGEFGEPVAVTGIGPDEGLTTLGDLIDSARITIRAPRRTWENLTPRDFRGEIDLIGLEAGQHEPEVHVESRLPEVEVLEVQPARVRVRLDQTVSKTVPVRVDVLDSPAFGYDWQTPIVEPSDVTVTGAATYVDQVSVATVDVFLRGARTNHQSTRPVTLRDAQGDVTGFVRYEPRTVQVTVPIVQQPGRREVTVLVQPQGQPAPGYRVSNVTVEPPVVMLFGNPDDIADLPGFVETEPLSIAGASADVVERLPLLLPEGVSAFNTQSVLVRVSITPIEGGLTVRRPPIIQGLGRELVAHVPLQSVDVILAGPLPKLEHLGPEDVRVILDLGGLEPGVYTVTPTVVVPEGIRKENILPATIEVHIEPDVARGPGGVPPRSP